MRERVDILRMTDSYADGMGGMHRVLEKEGTYWCHASEVSASRAEVLYNTEVISPIEFTIRAASVDLTTEDLIRYRGIEYKIHSIRHDYQRRYKIVLAYGNEND